MEDQAASKRILELTERIEELERENKRLRTSIEPPQKVELPRQQIPVTLEKSNAIQHLSNDEIERYSRQLLLSNGFRVEGQKQLLLSSVCIIGAGGIGSTGKKIRNKLASVQWNAHGFLSSQLFYIWQRVALGN